MNGERAIVRVAAALVLLSIVAEGHPPLVKLFLRKATTVINHEKVLVVILRDGHLNEGSAGIPRVGDQFPQRDLWPTY